MVEKLDKELKFLLKITRRLPKIKGSGVLGNLIKKFYLRKKRKTLITKIFNFWVQVNPHECVDGELLFMPQLYDFKEIKYIKKNLNRGDIFIDVGANIGFYTLITSNIVGEKGKVISIEADPFNFRRLLTNIKLNNKKNIIPLNYGVSNKKEILKLGINNRGNRGGNSFLIKSNTYELIQCYPLDYIIKKHNIKKIDGIKLDIEGFEYRVLREFFKKIKKKLYPSFIIVEINHLYKESKKIMPLLEQRGYKKILKNHQNYIFIKK